MDENSRIKIKQLILNLNLRLNKDIESKEKSLRDIFQEKLHSDIKKFSKEQKEKITQNIESDLKKIIEQEKLRIKKILIENSSKKTLKSIFIKEKMFKEQIEKNFLKELSEYIDKQRSLSKKQLELNKRETEKKIKEIIEKSEERKIKNNDLRIKKISEDIYEKQKKDLNLKEYVLKKRLQSEFFNKIKKQKKDVRKQKNKLDEYFLSKINELLS